VKSFAEAYIGSDSRYLVPSAGQQIDSGHIRQCLVRALNDWKCWRHRSQGRCTVPGGYLYALSMNIIVCNTRRFDPNLRLSLLDFVIHTILRSRHRYLTFNGCFFLLYKRLRQRTGSVDFSYFGSPKPKKALMTSLVRLTHCQIQIIYL
jgi:hypothetical protein